MAVQYARHFDAAGALAVEDHVVVSREAAHDRSNSGRFRPAFGFAASIRDIL